MTSWGGYDGHLRVGIDWTISPSSPSHSDTSVSVTWRYYVDTDGWNFDDDETLHESATNWGGTADGFHNGSSGSAILVGTHQETYGISYNSGNVSASANLTGAYNGATPSHSVTVSLPNRPVATPSNGEGVTASSITTSSALLSWGAPDDNGGADVDEYELQVSTGSGFSSPAYDVTFSETGSASHTATGLNANTTYYARVRAHNSAGWGDWTSSTACKFTTSAGTPSTPLSLAYSTRSQTTMTVTWRASSTNGGGSITYTVECSPASDFSVSELVGNPTDTTYEFTGLTPDTPYYFRVKAVNSGGTSGWSSLLTEATLATNTYSDDGDLMTMIQNFASAVADKFVHLGTFVHRGRTTETVWPNAVTTYPWMNVQVGSLCTQPDPPTWNSGASNGVTQIVINYPGTYLIEYAQRFPGNVGGDFEQLIYVNSAPAPLSTSGKGGTSQPVKVATNEHGAMRTISCVRKLGVGDTVGFGIFNNEGASDNDSTANNSDLFCWARVTMIGF